MRNCIKGSLKSGFARHAVDDALAFHLMHHGHHNMAKHQRKQQKRQFAVEIVAQVGHLFDFFRQHPHNGYAEHDKIAARRTILANQTNQRHGNHQRI